MNKELFKICDNLIFWLTVFLIITFFVFGQYVWGSLVIIAIICSILVLTLIVNKGKISIKIFPFQVFTVLFVVYCLLNATWARDAKQTFEKATTIFSIILFYTFLDVYYRRFFNVTRLIKAVLWAGYFLVGYSFLFYKPTTVVQTLLSGNRLPNAFTNVNGLALVASFAIIIEVYFLIFSKASWRSVLTLPSAILVLATGSRKALLFLVVGVAVLLFIKFAKNNLIKALFFLLACLVFGFLSYKIIERIDAFNGIIQRFESLVAVIAGKTATDSGDVWRLAYLEVGKEQFRRTPLLGFGIGNSGYITMPLGRVTYLHNNYIELLACGGIVGTVIYYSAYLYLFYAFIRYRRVKSDETVVCIVLMIITLLLDIGMVSYYDKFTYFCMYLFFAQARNCRDTTLALERRFNKNRCSTKLLEAV